MADEPSKNQDSMQTSNVGNVAPAAPSPKPSNPRPMSRIVMILALIVLLPAVGIYAASKFQPKHGVLGKVVFHAYDVTGGGKVVLSGVNIHIQAVGASAFKCDG